MTDKSLLEIGRSLPPSAMRVSHQVALTKRPGLMLAMFGVIVTGLVILIHVSARIGMEPFAAKLLALALPAGVLIFATLKYSTTRLRQFNRIEGAAKPIEIGLAGGLELIGLLGLIVFGALYSETNHQATAAVAGMVCGLVILSTIILPRAGLALSADTGNQSANSMFHLHNVRSGKMASIARRYYGLIGLVCSFTLALIALDQSERILLLAFGSWSPMLLVAFIILATALVMGGGYRSLTLANTFLYCLVLAMIFVPAVWLSMRIAGHPFAHLGFGAGALSPIVQLTAQLEESSDGGIWGNLSEFTNFTGFAALFLLSAAGLSSLPMLHQRAHCAGTVSMRIRGTAWGLVFFMLVLSAIPALYVFVQYEIFRGIVGLSPDQLGSGAGWLFSWAAKENGVHALVCGSPATSAQAIAIACGGSDHQIIPSDLNFSSHMIFLGMGSIANMPVAVGMMSLIAILATSLAMVCTGLVAGASVMVEHVFFAKHSGPNDENQAQANTGHMKRLFFSRLTILTMAIGAYILAVQIPNVPVDTIFWIFGLAASSLFVPLIMSLWWSKSSGIGLIVAGLSGTGLFATFLIAQFIYRQDVPGMLIGSIDIHPAAFASLISMAVALILGIILTLIIRVMRARKQAEA